MKDNFSSSSDNYAKYRPTYPVAFYNYLNNIVAQKENVWDCGTGTGQVAFELAKTFKNVYATDISQSQLDNALEANNIQYSIQPAESTNFYANLFDVIIVAQAIHWFGFDAFYSEVRRTAKEDALICILGYERLKISEEIDTIISDFYYNTIGSYWDKERKYIDESYETIPFPFEEIETPSFSNKLKWTLDDLIGYLNTWSAVKRFIKKNNYNPVDILFSQIEPIWEESASREVTFPILLRIGRVN